MKSALTGVYRIQSISYPTGNLKKASCFLMLRYGKIVKQSDFSKKAGLMEQKSIFREKSLERVTSPEQLNDYIKVTTPSVWMILIATLILIIGTLFWSVFGKIQVNTDTGVKETAPINYVIR